MKTPTTRAFTVPSARRERWATCSAKRFDSACDAELQGEPEFTLRLVRGIVERDVIGTRVI
jgi:hypothetical protein